MISLNLPKRFKILRVIDTGLSVFMSEEEIRTSIWVSFKDIASYENIKNLKPTFWKNFHDSWCSHLLDDTKEAYDLSNHIKVPRKKIGVLTTSNIYYFHGKLNVLSILRSPFKLKIFNYSHRRHSELTIHRGSMIEVIFPKNCFIMFYYGLVHCGTSSWFISRGEYSSNTGDFLQL